MKELFAVEVEDRDEVWEETFFGEILKAQFRFLSDTPIEGPDGMSYLAVEVVEDGEPADKVFDWLGEKGVGLAVNPNKEHPDYVFSYGMIWNQLLNGEFLTPMETNKEGHQEVEFSEGQEMMAGTPSESYWPMHTRGIFKEFLNQQGIHKPRVVMLSQDSKTYDLCFSLQSLGNPPQEEWQGILEAFSWFFPMHYSFSIISEDVIQGIEFTEV